MQKILYEKIEIHTIMVENYLSDDKDSKSNKRIFI
jgi:hypothetical protein